VADPPAERFMPRPDMSSTAQPIDGHARQTPRATAVALSLAEWASLPEVESVVLEGPASGLRYDPRVRDAHPGG
jgi:hypothetical protein